MASPPPYIPAPAFCRGSLLTASQLIADFQDLYANLEYISCAPVFVFERLVSSLNQVFTTALERERLEHASTLGRERLQHASAFERERLQHASALEKSRKEIEVLQLSNGELKKELTKLREAKDQGNTSDTLVEPKMHSSNPIIGTFDTLEVRSCGPPCAEKTSKKISFAAPYSAPPGLVVGLNILDITNDADIRVKSYASNIQKDSFNINIDSWGDTKLCRGGCVLLEVAPGDPDFQFGNFNYKDSYPEASPQSSWRSITFSKAYRAPPRVVVWLTSLELSCSTNWRMRACADRVTATGFVIHLDTYYSSEILSATASWIAYPADKPNIHSGRFSTLDFRPLGCPQPQNNAYESFGSNIFTTPPRTLLAIDSFDIDCRQNMRLGVWPSSVSAAGMTWHADSWDDSKLYCAGVSYIALGSP